LEPVHLPSHIQVATEVHHTLYSGEWKKTILKHPALSESKSYRLET